jgi:translocation and assembly module TamA
MLLNSRYYLSVSVVIFFYSALSLASNNIQIETTGISEEMKKNIVSMLDVSVVTQSSPTQIRQYFSSSPSVVKKALEPFGYFKAVVHYKLRYAQGKWIAKFEIMPGPPLRMHKVEIKITGSGKQEKFFQKILQDASLRKGEIFSVPKYNALKRSLFNTALAYGYFDAKFDDARIVINLAPYTSEITLHFDTGIRYKFGSLSFNKNPYDSKFLTRFADFSPHAYYEADKVQSFQQALSNSGYFREVFLDTKVEHKENDAIPIEVKIKPLPANQYNLGLGYGTDMGVRGLAGFERRRLTPSGQRIKTEIQASQTNSNLQASYIIPGAKPATDQYTLSAGIQHENQVLGQSDLQKITASYVKKMGQWQQTMALTLQRERFLLEDLPEQTQLLFIPSVGWLRSWQDDLLRPSRGGRISVDFLYAPSIFKNPQFFQSRFGFKTIYPILKKDRVVFRTNLSYTFIQNIKDLPLSLQSFAGGAQSIRGYSYNAIGPGKIAWVGSLEYQRHIKGDWYLAGFYDVGNVSDNFSEDIKRGIGIGVVWQSPVGALQLTVAQAQDLPGKPISIQFSMGPAL